MLLLPLLACFSCIALCFFSSTAYAAPPTTFEAAKYRQGRLFHAKQGANCGADATICGPHGTCDDNACVCKNNDQDGHWSGSYCTECATGWAGSACKTFCRGGSCNACNAHGTCNEGTTGDGTCTCFNDPVKGYWSGVACTQCADNYFGSACDQPCPGVELTAEACFGRGRCESDVLGNGICYCTDGWGGSSGCFECDHAHYGAGCKNQCEGFITVERDGATYPEACSGHGVCFNGTTANGTCVCAEGTGYGTRDCSVQCPNLCSGHGFCREGAQQDATCLCSPGFAPPDCQFCVADKTGEECTIPCLVGPNGMICSGNGNCTYNPAEPDVTLAAQCVCALGYVQGGNCHLACPGSPPCSGHGECVNDGPTPRCSCQQSAETGFWTGDTCDTCMPEYNRSVECNTRCPPFDGSAPPCSGHGQCYNGVCFCERGVQLEYCGVACEESSTPGARSQTTQQPILCAAQYCDRGIFGENCDQSCPGRAGTFVTTTCNQHGQCDQGRLGTGVCTCESEYTGAACNIRCANNTEGLICSGFGRGTCETDPSTGQPYCNCRAAFAGAACQINCPKSGGLICAGHGVCHNTFAGDGSCSCEGGWTGPRCDVPCLCNEAHGSCNAEVCSNLTSAHSCSTCTCDGNFTGFCDQCRSGTQGESCEGACIHGTTVGRTCVCEEFWSTAACDVPCPRGNVTGRICSGNGTCIWGETQQGQCSCFPAGDPSYFGSACDVFCTPDLCRRTTPFLNPQCNPESGKCECQDNTQGHWAGDVCAECKRGYWGPACKEECQCSGHGSCDINTGECRCFASALLGFYSGQNCDQCAGGYIGQNCERRNIQITRLQRLNETDALLKPPPAAARYTSDAAPTPYLIHVDSSRRVLLVGGSPVYAMDVSTTTMREIATSADGANLPSAPTSTTAAATTPAPGATLAPGAGCTDTHEAFHVWTYEDDVYYLMQPEPFCNKPVRILKGPRRSEVIDFSTMEPVWSDQEPSRLNMRVRSASALRETQRSNPIVAFVLVTFSLPGSLGQQQPGGIVVAVDPVLAASEDSQDSEAVSELDLSTQFTALSIAASLDAVERSDDTDFFVVAIGGSTPEGWETFLYRRQRGVDFEDAIPSAGSASLRSQVQCWPVIGSAVGGGGGSAAADGSALESCEGCLRVNQVMFSGANLVMAVQKITSDTVNTTVVIVLRPFFSLPAGEKLWAPVSTSTSQCSLAKYIASSEEVQDVTDADRRAPVTVFYSAVLSDADELGAVASSMTLDIEANVVFVCLDLTSISRPSMLVKFSLRGNFSLYGKRQLNYVSSQSRATMPEVFSAMAVDSDSRLLYALVTGVQQLRIVTFLLYEVHSITPNIADQRGGTRIAVQGLGFKQLLNATTNEVLYPVACQFGGKAVVAAENISFTSLDCVVTAIDNVSSTTAACDGQATEVSLYGDTWWTENTVALKRVQSPRVDSVSPDRGGLAGGTTLTVTGQGFIESVFATCAFWSDSPFATELLYSPMRYITPNMAACTQPKASEASFDNSFLNISLDGQLYAEQGPVPYQIVGEPANLSSPVAVTRGALAETHVAINVTVVDSQNHFLGSLDKQNKSICILPNITSDPCDEAEFSWRTEDDGYPWPPCRNTSLRFGSTNDTVSVLCRDTYQGLVEFDDIVFDQPRASRMILTFHALDFRSYPWETLTRVTITEGAAHALAIANRKDLVDVSIVDGQALTPPPEIIVIDTLGNVLQSTEGTLIVTAQTSYVMDDTREVEMTNSYTLTQRQDGNRIRFSLIFFKFVHGATHYIDFTSDPPLVPTRAPPLRTSLCDNPSVNYKVSNSSECQPCPPAGAVCNGTELVRVLAGFWRGNTTTFIYKCPAGPLVCLGSAALEGSNCAEGYMGPLCSQCWPGWGHDSATTCTKCDSMATAIAFVLGGAIVFLAVLLIWTTVTLRAPEVTDLTVIGRTVVNHMQATGKLGEFSTQWDPFLKDIFAVQNSASSVSVNGLSSLDCLLRNTGNDYSAVFLGYMMLPFVSVIMAIGVFVVVRVMKMQPIISDELEIEIREDIKSMGRNARTAILLQRYPLYMVVTTTLCVNMFAMYQTLITQSTVVLQCRTFVTQDGVSKSYLDVDMSIPCDENGNHKFRTAAMLCAIVYGFGIPTAFFFGYKFMNGRIGKPALTRMMFMFLIGGYKTEYWFWQAIIMVRKMILVLIIVFVGENTQLQSYCGMWAMSVALIVQIWFQPNSKPEFNLVEALSLAIITVTLNLGLLYFWPAMPEFGKNALTATLILITLGATCMFGYFVYKPLLETVKEKVDVALDTAKEFKEKAQERANAVASGATDLDDDARRKMVFRSRDRFNDDDYADDDDLAGVPMPGQGGLHRPMTGFKVRERPQAAAPTFDEAELNERYQGGGGGGATTTSSDSAGAGRPQLPQRLPRHGGTSGLRRAEYEAL